MLPKQTRLISDSGRSAALPQATSQTGDWHDATGHHRYYGGSACNGGERIVENRRGPCRPSVNLFGF